MKESPEFMLKLNDGLMVPKSCKPASSPEYDRNHRYVYPPTPFPAEQVLVTTPAGTSARVGDTLAVRRPTTDK
jgi:hypothetical protein